MNHSPPNVPILEDDDERMLQDSLRTMAPLDTAAMKGKVALRLGLGGTSPTATTSMGTSLAAHSVPIFSGAAGTALVLGGILFMQQADPASSTETPNRPGSTEEQRRAAPSDAPDTVVAPDARSLPSVPIDETNGSSTQDARLFSGESPASQAEIASERIDRVRRGEGASKTSVDPSSLPLSKTSSRSLPPSRHHADDAKSAAALEVQPVSAPHLLYQATRALRQSGDPARALELLDEYKAAGRGSSEEVLALTMEAYSRLGSPRAFSLAQRYLETYEHGRYRVTATRILARAKRSGGRP